METAETHHSAHGNERESIGIAIFGGGISGLCLVLGLLNTAPHLHIHIYEAADHFAAIGAGVAFGINAQRALWKLDPRLGEAYSKLSTSNVDANTRARKETYLRVVMGMDHATLPLLAAGTKVSEVFCEGGFSSVHRARLLDAMLDLLPDDFRNTHVTFGARLVSLHDVHHVDGRGRVKLTFADGRIACADAAIGCDGIRSQLRRILLEAEEAQPVFSGNYAYRGLIPMDRAVAALGDRSARNAHHRIGYGGHVLTFPIDKGKTMNVVAFRTKSDRVWPADAEWVTAATKEQMHADFAGWGQDVHAILDMMERSDMWALFDHAPAHTYHRGGQLCLIGDAAHASTPHHGSGAGMAVEDALLISSLLSDVQASSQLHCVFSTFEAMRKERTQRLVQQSRMQCMIYDFEAPETGDDVEKIAQILPHRWDWIWDHDVEAELQTARMLLADSTHKSPPFLVT